MVSATQILTKPKLDKRMNKHKMLTMATRTMEYAEFVELDAPKLAP